MVYMVKRLGRCVGAYKKESLFAPLFIILEVLMEVIIPTLMGFLIDKGINGNGGEGDLRYLIKMGLLLALCCVLSLVFGVLSGNFAAKASAGFAKNLRKEMFYNVQNFSFSNIDKFSTSSIVTRLTTDVSNIQNAFMMIIRVAVRSPIMLIFALIMAFRLNRKLACVFLLVTPLLAVGIYTIMSHAHPIFEKVFKTYDKLNNVVQENLRGIRVVKAFVREDKEREKFNEVSDSIYQRFVSAEKIISFNGPLMQFCMYLCMLLIAWFGARFIVRGNMTEGHLSSMLTYTMQILMSLMMLSMIFLQLVISMASARRIVEIIDEKSDLTNGENPVYEVKDGSISFENVSFSYAANADKLCLSGVNIEIKSGETVGIIGGTGSSKTTFVQLIPRLYDATIGCIKVGGVDVRDYDLDTLRNNVAMVLQKNVLFSGTIKENLRWGCESASDEQLVNACKSACADEFIREFPDGYDTYIEQGGSNVSGGQKQRLCIARALLKKPKILILDDSTSAVDTNTDAMIRRAFREDIPNTTKLIIAQRISSIQDADKIIVLDSGMVNGFGTHEELLANNEIYREVYESQMKGGDDNG